MTDAEAAGPAESSGLGGLHDLQHLRVTRDGALLLVELDRPQVRNACDTTTHLELQAVVHALRGPAGDCVRALVVAGRGPSFCAGSDVRHTGGLDGPALQRYVALDAATKDAVATCPVPTVAWVHGYALGGGFELALACDFRAVAPDAQLGLPEAAIGTLPGAGGIQRLTALVGPARAREIVLLGRRVEASAALDLGLATWRVDGPASLAACRTLLEPLLALDPTVVRLARAAIAPLPAVTPLEHTFHELAAAAAHASGTFDRATAAHRQRGR
jgi:enoyl-CoA hydratase/carnithine racemase